MYTTLAFFNLGPAELICLAILGLLIFGKRLPEVGKNLGKGIVEFKKGLAGVDEEANRSAAASGGGMQSLPSGTTPRAALPAGHSGDPASAEEQMTAMREQLRQLSEQLRATQEQLRATDRK